MGGVRGRVVHEAEADALIPAHVERGSASSSASAEWSASLPSEWMRSLPVWAPADVSQCRGWPGPVHVGELMPAAANAGSIVPSASPPRDVDQGRFRGVDVVT